MAHIDVEDNATMPFEQRSGDVQTSFDIGSLESHKWVRAIVLSINWFLQILKMARENYWKVK